MNWYKVAQKSHSEYLWNIYCNIDFKAVKACKEHGEKYKATCFLTEADMPWSYSSDTPQDQIKASVSLDPELIMRYISDDLVINTKIISNIGSTEPLIPLNQNQMAILESLLHHPAESIGVKHSAGRTITEMLICPFV